MAVRILLLALISLTACTWQGATGPSTLVIAVEHLSFEHLNCESGDLGARDLEGFRAFCEEGVRFTHAFTTSTLSQAALASLFTGLYPIEHGVRHNGPDFLSAQFNTVAESAAVSRLRTSFFSGGPPILRKSGLSQGFDTFDDRFGQVGQRFYRPARDVVTAFLSWLDREAGRSRFFSVLYLSDLQFPEFATVSDLGEVRDRSLDGQLREVSESLGMLIEGLKSRGLWHRVHFLLTGLNGSPGTAHPSDPPPINIFADNTQVALFFKPARPSRDQGPQWTVDKNVSLADVGLSLYELTGGVAPEPTLKSLPRVSLFRFVTQPQADWNDNRLILIESAWGAWRQLSTVRYAARRQQYLYVHDAKPQIYNTLVDRRETNPLPPKDPLWMALAENMLSLFRELQFKPWQILDEVNWRRILASQAWWSGKPEQKSWLSDLPPATGARWRAERALAQGDWRQLLEIGEQGSDPFLVYVAKKNLGERTRLPRGSCGKLFASKRPRALSGRVDLACGEETFGYLIDWANAGDDGQRARAFDAFLGLYRTHRDESLFGSANYSRFLPWDVSTSMPAGLSFSDLYLALPERKSFAEILNGRLSGENRDFDL